MKRATIGLDRTVAIVLGVVFVLLGLLGIAWWQGVLLDQVPRAASVGSSTASGIRSGVGQSWWPWVAGIVGLLLALLGVSWFVRHFTYRGVRTHRLPGSDRGGRLTASSGALISAAAEQLQDTRGVRSVSGSMTDERGALVVDLSVTADPGADLGVVAGDIDAAVTDLAGALANPAATYRTQLSVARSQKLDT